MKGLWLNNEGNIYYHWELLQSKIDMPLYFAPTALQRLFNHDGELAVGKAADKVGTMFGISSLGTVSVEEISKISKGFNKYNIDRKIVNLLVNYKLK